MQNKETILFITQALVIIGMGYLFYSDYQLRKTLVFVPNPSQYSPDSPAITPANSDKQLAIGSGGIISSAIDGPVEGITANSLSLRTEDGLLAVVQVSSETRIVREGERKSMAQYQQELDAFSARVVELSKEPEKNHAELKALTTPLSVSVTPAELSDIRVGDVVTVTIDKADTGNQKKAIQIFIQKK